MRAALSLFLAALVASPAHSAPSVGFVQGVVSLDGRPLQGVELTLVDLISGSQHRTRSGENGDFKMAVAPGSYVITNQGRQGLAVGRGPATIAVQSGQIASATIDLVAIAGALLQQPGTPPPVDPAAPGAFAPMEGTSAGTVVNHEAVNCLVAGEFPMLDTEVQPASQVARVRLYFKSSTSEYYYSDMQVVEGRYRGWMPKPTLAASPITYYIEATTTEFGEARTAEIQTIVVNAESECKGKVAAIAPPPAGLTFFSAASGAVVVPAGFAVGGLAALGVGTAALIAAGGAAAIATTVVVTNSDESPSPSPAASPSTTPTPTPPPGPGPTPPSPSPSPTPEPPPPPVSPFR